MSPSPHRELLRLRLRAAMRQRSRHRRFRFQFRQRREGLEVRLASRRSAFRASVTLRPGTSDSRTFAQVFLDDFYDLSALARAPELAVEFARRAQAGPPLILDLGANIGLASLELLHQWPGAQVVAVEPEPGNCVQLRRHLQPFPRTHVVEGAVGACDGAVEIENPDGPSAGFRTRRVERGSPHGIPAYSVPSLLERAAAEGAGAPFLVKIDIEGFEEELFRGEVAWADAFPVVMLEPHDWARPRSASSAPFLRWLAGSGRDVILLGESVVAIAHRLD